MTTTPSEGDGWASAKEEWCAQETTRSREEVQKREDALALLFGSGKVVKTASSKEIEARLAALRPLREAGLKQLEVFALLGQIPAKVPTGIRKGNGPLDSVRDAVAIPGAFHDYHDKIGDNHPFTPAILEKLGAEGSPGRYIETLASPRRTR
ncbi:MAG: hypothetical protein ABI134_32370 [Byssovorax sp.]